MVPNASAMVRSLLAREGICFLFGRKKHVAITRGGGTGIAYGIQDEILGGVRPELQQKLLAGPGKSVQVARKTVLKPGVRLVREWNGKTHHVEVTENGFSWNGGLHASLSGIAREITGTQWSGPRFFGLRS
ncbi:MAG: DUF2924 domain-containing protein [Hyphomicrobiales bacterium]